MPPAASSVAAVDAPSMTRRPGRVWRVLSHALPAGADVAAFALPIPSAASIAGVVLHAQALIAEPAGTGSQRFTSLLSAAIR